MSAHPRPAIEEVVAAVQRRHLREARTLLRQWCLPLEKRYILGMPTWVIGRYGTSDFQAPLWQALEQLPPLPEAPCLVLGGWAFWHQLSRAMWRAEKYDELQQRISGVMGIYDPEMYRVWGRLLARKHHTLSAGMYLLLSGMATSEERAPIARFKQMCKNMQPNQVISQLPKPCRTRRARSIFPEQVYWDFADVPCPPWWRRRPTP